MPELAEVDFYRRQWDPGLTKTIVKVHTHPPARVFRDVSAQAVQDALSGRRFTASMAHGKRMCFQFSGNVWLGLHLGMAGSLLTATPEIVPSRHEHLVLSMDSVALVFSDYRMFGKVQLHQGEHPPPWWDKLPPQPQETAFDKIRFRKILRKHPRKPLKALLLQQDAFPGIGNWMADEILWRSRLHPARMPRDLSPYFHDKLFNSIKEVCEDAFRVIATDWGTPPDTWLFNHRWKRGTSCPVSNKPLEWIIIAGRTTCYSPAIQKLP